MKNLDLDNNINTSNDPKRGKICAHCGEEIHQNNSKFKIRKFCSTECNRRYFSLQRYYKIKDSKEYKDYRKIYYKKWLSKNRDKFNASMRKASLKYQAKKKKEREMEKITQVTQVKKKEKE